MKLILTIIKELFAWHALSKFNVIYATQSLNIGQTPEYTSINFWIYGQILDVPKLLQLQKQM